MQEIRDSEESHSAMFASLQERLKDAVATIEGEAESAITTRFEPVLEEHVRDMGGERG